MTINQQNHVAEIPRAQTVMAMGGILGALAASSCCILPLTLFSLGISGAWIANFTRLALSATLVFLGTGYWLVLRASKRICADGEDCARPLPNRLVKATLIVATALVLAGLGFDFLAPLLFNS